MQETPDRAGGGGFDYSTDHPVASSSSRTCQCVDVYAINKIKACNLLSDIGQTVKGHSGLKQL